MRQPTTRLCPGGPRCNFRPYSGHSACRWHCIEPLGILDVSVSDPGNANNSEIVLGKLSLAGWRSWTSDEQRVIEGFIDVWFEQALKSDLAGADEDWIGTDAESVLCGAARAGMSLQPWLLRLSAPDAMPVLLDMKQRFPGDMSGFWEFAPDGLRELSTILTQGRA